MTKFICNICKKEYKYEKVLNNHINNKHNQSNDEELDNDVEEEQNEPEISYAKLKPLVKWSGGKFDEIPKFISHIPNDYEIYLEPFIGGASVLLNVNPKKAVISDVHKELIDFYNSIKSGASNEIYKFMERKKNDEETYYDIRDNMNYDSVLDNAKRFYYLRKTCFRGMMRYNKKGKFNIPFGKYKSINFEDLKKPIYETIFKNCDILNNSYEYIFENYNSKKNFMFLDPPYDSEFTDYGYCSFDKEHQKKLADYFKKTKIRCLMIIGKTDFISELYKDYIVNEYDKKYKFRLHSNRVGNEINTKHLIIKNY